MSRKLDPGEVGTPSATPVVRNAAGKWVRVPSGRHKPDAWRARAFYCTLAGDVREVSVRRPKRYVAEQDAVNEARSRVDADADGDRWTTKMLLVDAVASYLDGVDERGERAPRTMEVYRSAAKAFGEDGSPVRKLTLSRANDVQTLTRFLQHVAEVHGKGTEKQVRVIVRGTLSRAVRFGVLPGNAARDVERVTTKTFNRTRRNHDRALSPDQLANLRHVALERVNLARDPRSTRKMQAVHDLVSVMMVTGVRVGEARMLRWEDLDAETGRLLVHGTKTDAADRVAWLSADAVVMLADRHGAAGSPASGLMFPAPSSGAGEWDASNLGKELRRLFDAAGLEDFTPHALRRTVVSSLLDHADVSDQLVSGLVGHSDSSFTRKRYGDTRYGDVSSLADLLPLPSPKALVTVANESADGNDTGNSASA